MSFFQFLQFLKASAAIKCQDVVVIVSESLKILGTVYKNFLLLQLNYTLLTTTPTGPKKQAPHSERVKLGNEL